jgi:hypothetical protein
MGGGYARRKSQRNNWGHSHRKFQRNDWAIPFQNPRDYRGLFPPKIPTGFHPLAQGCAGRRYPGRVHTQNGRQPQRGCIRGAGTANDARNWGRVAPIPGYFKNASPPKSQRNDWGMPFQNPRDNRGAFPSEIPTGFYHLAQGCAGRRYPGYRAFKTVPNPNGVASKARARPMTREIGDALSGTHAFNGRNHGFPPQ